MADLGRMIEQAIILAGGKGTRLWPLTQNTPKPLVLVSQKPFLVWQLLYLKNQGFRRALLLVSHFADQIIQYFEKHPIEGLEIEFSVEPEAMGTGGALTNAMALLEDSFFVLNGDSFAPIPYREMEEEFNKSKADICMAVTAADVNPEVPGNVRAQGSKLVEYRKDGGANAGYSWIDAGVYVYKKSALDGVELGTYGIEKTWTQALQKQAVVVYPVSQRFFDIGTPDRLQFFEKNLPQFFNVSKI